MSLDDFDESTCSTLDQKDIRLIEEIINRMRFGMDLARLEASKQRLESSIKANAEAQSEATRAQNLACQAGLGPRYCEIAAKRRLVFTHSPFFLFTSPFVASYLDACDRADLACDQ